MSRSTSPKAAHQALCYDLVGRLLLYNVVVKLLCLVQLALRLIVHALGVWLQWGPSSATSSGEPPPPPLAGADSRRRLCVVSKINAMLRRAAQSCTACTAHRCQGLVAGGKLVAGGWPRTCSRLTRTLSSGKRSIAALISCAASGSAPHSRPATATCSCTSHTAKGWGLKTVELLGFGEVRYAAQVQRCVEACRSSSDRAGEAVCACAAGAVCPMLPLTLLLRQPTAVVLQQQGAIARDELCIVEARLAALRSRRRAGAART